MARKKQEPNRVDEMLDELLADCQTPEDILGESGLLKQLEQMYDAQLNLSVGIQGVSLETGDELPQVGLELDSFMPHSAVENSMCATSVCPT